MSIHIPPSYTISRRKLLRILPAPLIAHILGSCGDNSDTSVPQKRHVEPIASSPVEKALDNRVAETTRSVEPEILPEIPPIPNNRFMTPPDRSIPGDTSFLAKVKKVTMEQRKAQMIAANGGGRVGDEVARLQKSGLKPFENLGEIQNAYRAGKLIHLPSIDEGRYFAVGIIGTADSDNREWYNLIHPDAYERFNTHVARVFYHQTGKMLKVGGLVRSSEYQAKLRKGNSNATKNRSSHEFGRTIDFSIPEVFNPATGRMEAMSSEERECISKLLTYYEMNAPERTSWLVENGNCYHGTHFPLNHN